MWISYKLGSQVLYLEASNERYEISKIDSLHYQEEEIFIKNPDDNLFENSDLQK